MLLLDHCLLDSFQESFGVNATNRFPPGWPFEASQSTPRRKWDSRNIFGDSLWGRRQCQEDDPKRILGWKKLPPSSCFLFTGGDGDPPVWSRGGEICNYRSFLSKNVEIDIFRTYQFVKVTRWGGTITSVTFQPRTTPHQRLY